MSLLFDQERVIFVVVDPGFAMPGLTAAVSWPDPLLGHPGSRVADGLSMKSPNAASQ